MEDVEARIRCLEIAATLSTRTGDHSAEAIVKTATVLYSFTQTSLQASQPVVNSDKPKRGKPAKEADILS